MHTHFHVYTFTETQPKKTLNAIEMQENLRYVSAYGGRMKTM